MVPGDVKLKPMNSFPPSLSFQLFKVTVVEPTEISLSDPNSAPSIRVQFWGTVPVEGMAPSSAIWFSQRPSMKAELDDASRDIAPQPRWATANAAQNHDSFEKVGCMTAPGWS